MSRLASLACAFALTCSFAAVAQTPAQSPTQQPTTAAPIDVVPDRSVPQSAEDVSNCGPRDKIVAQLGQVFQEAQDGMGIIDTTAVVEVFVSDAGTFTILASGTDGTSCILASGEGWDSVRLVADKDA